MSAGRLYLYIVYSPYLSGHFHESHIDKASKDLGISRKTILNNIYQLKKLNVLTKYSKGYWRMRSWGKFGDVKIKKGVKVRLEDIRDLSKLRSLSFYSEVRSSIRLSKKNRIHKTFGKLKELGPRNDSAKWARASFPGEEVSLGFIKKVTGNTNCISTLSRHISKLNDLDYINRTRNVSIIATGKTYKELLLHNEHLDEEGQGAFITSRKGLNKLLCNDEFIDAMARYKRCNDDKLISKQAKYFVISYLPLLLSCNR